MTILYQTHLGSTVAKLLTIVDLQGPPVWPWTIIQPKEAHILHKLPDELLLLIVELSCYDHSASENHAWARCEGVIAYDSKGVKALSHVCHRFKRIAQPLLFNAITFGWADPMAPPSMPALKLHRTLRERIDLRQHCRWVMSFLFPYILRCPKPLALASWTVINFNPRSLISLETFLCVDMEDGYTPRKPVHYSVAKDIISWLMNVKRLYVRDASSCCHRPVSRGHRRDNTTLTWDLIRHAVARMNQVEHFYVDSHWYNVDVGPVFEWLEFPRLRSLDILNAQLNADVKLEDKKHRAAPFTRLKLDMANVSIGAISLLIQWPAVLTHFILEAYPDRPHVLDYAMLETWLLIHKETLLHVKICYARQQSNKAFFNASLFPKLQYLQLWRWPKDVRLPSENESLLGRSLETFCWDFSPSDRTERDMYESWSPLGEDEILWMQTLAKSAFECQAALKAIVIKYTLKDHCMCRQSIKYPWDYLKATRDQISKLGIELVYDDPRMSKAELMHYYQTGETPYRNFWGEAVANVPTYWATSKGNEEEELELERFYDDLLRDSLNHGEDVRKYLLD